MSASNNFITRPVLSTVCSLLIVIVGLIAIPILLIDNSPAEIDLRRLRLFYLMVVTSGGLGGFAIETMRQLQEEATDPLYRPKNPYRGRRPF